MTSTTSVVPPLETVSLQNASSVPIETLASYYKQCKDSYFNTDTPLVNDATFDTLESILRQRAPNHPVLKAVGASSKTNKVKLPFWMGSQNKMYPDDATVFKSWQKKNGKDTAVATAKLDGLSALLVITASSVQLYSRGDGQYASDWTHHLKHLKSLVIPIQHTQEYLKQHLKIKRVLLRGEAIMSHTNYTKHQTHENWTSTARNIVSGLLSGKKSATQLLRCVDVVFYEVIEPRQSSFQEQLQWLQHHQFKNVGFSMGKTCNSSVLSSDFTLSDLEPFFWSYREHCPYATDGVVVQNNTPPPRNLRDNPNYSFAFKIRVNDASQVAETTVITVEWNTSRHGRLIPTVVFKPIRIANVSIERTTGFHYKFILENGIGKGAVVQIRRCGDVIPNIVAVKKSAKAHLPDQPFTVTKTRVDALAVNIETSKTYQVRKLVHFFKVMNVPRMSVKTVMKFVEQQHTTAFEILCVNANTMQSWGGFATKSSEQLVKDLHTCTHQASALQWVHAGAVFGEGIGERHLEYLMPNAPQLFQTHPLTTIQRSALRAHLLSLHGYQTTTVDHLLKHHDDFVQYWKQVDTYLHGKPPSFPQPASESVSVSPQQDLFGKVYCFTDVRDKAMEERLKHRGAKIATSMSKNVDVLICADMNGSSTKLTKAKAFQQAGTNIQIQLYKK